MVDANEEVEHVRLWVDGREVAVIGGEVGRLRFGTGDVLVEARVDFPGRSSEPRSSTTASGYLSIRLRRLRKGAVS